MSKKGLAIATIYFTAMTAVAIIIAWVVGKIISYLLTNVFSIYGTETPIIAILFIIGMIEVVANWWSYTYRNPFWDVSRMED